MGYNGYSTHLWWLGDGLQLMMFVVIQFDWLVFMDSPDWDHCNYWMVGKLDVAPNGQPFNKECIGNTYRKYDENMYIGQQEYVRNMQGKTTGE